MRACVTALFGLILLFAAGFSTISAQKVDRPLRIISKPGVRLNGDCGSSGDGRMRVRVTFSKDAKVTSVEVLERSACKVFDERAVKAAYRIKFEPAIKDGQEVTVTRLIEYKYDIY